jgi:SAM-dependent methyltransferase
MAEHDHGYEHHHGHGHKHEHGEDPLFAELLDLDGAVLRDYWSAAIGWVRSVAADPVRHIVDLGAGTGAGSLALAEFFPDAQVSAVDLSPDSVARIELNAEAAGVADRVHGRQADLDEAWPALGPIDLAWASMSVHHLADPPGALRMLHERIRPGGLLAVAEFEEPIRVLADGESRPGLEDRALAALADQHRAALPYLGADWANLLVEAGFADVQERTITIDVHPPYPPGTDRYAGLWLNRLRTGPGEHLDAEDRAALEKLIAEIDVVAGRGGVHLRGSRTVYLGRRF